MQVCRSCKANKNFEQFIKSKRYKTGYDTICKECESDRSKRRYDDPRYYEYKSTYRKDYSEQHIEYQRQYREANRERLAEQCRQKKEHKKQLDREYAEKFPDKIAAKAAKRRSLKLQATPSWANEKYIQMFYRLAREETLRTGKEVHVDHIIPLKSKNVCGLHCEDNLQLLFKEDNIRKSNKHE